MIPKHRHRRFIFSLRLRNRFVLLLERILELFFRLELMPVEKLEQLPDLVCHVREQQKLFV